MAVDQTTIDRINLQVVVLNSGLLVYLDPLKKSRLLDAWFQLVTDP